MGIKKISGEELFQIPSDKFIIGATASGYTLNYSADGVSWTAWEEATAANDNQVVVNIPFNTYCKLAGNTSNDVLIRW